MMARDNLPSVGHELDERVAIEVFGQGQPAYTHHKEGHLDPVVEGMWFCLPDYCEGDNCLWEPMHFSLYMREAWKIVEHMESLGFYPLIQKGRYVHDRDLWCALFKKDRRATSGVLACAQTPAHAICLAALQAIKGK